MFNLSDFFTWLISSGGAIIAANWILGQIPGYQVLLDNAKKWIFFAVAVVLAAGAYAGVTYIPATVLTAIQPYFLIVSTAFIAIFLNKAYTKLVAVEKNLKSLRASFQPSVTQATKK